MSLYLFVFLLVTWANHSNVLGCHRKIIKSCKRFYHEKNNVTGKSINDNIIVYRDYFWNIISSNKRSYRDRPKQHSSISDCLCFFIGSLRRRRRRMLASLWICQELRWARWWFDSLLKPAGKACSWVEEKLSEMYLVKLLFRKLTDHMMVADDAWWWFLTGTI